MNKPIHVGLTTGKAPRLITALILKLLVVADRAFNANGQTLTNLYSFTGNGNGHDGANPVAGLAQGGDGNFYGTTENGGGLTAFITGNGTVFRISPNGDFIILYAFTGGLDGRRPLAGLVQGRDGKLYGTTQEGGSNNQGTVFSITPNGSFTNLHSFSSPDGILPYSKLVQGSDGNFYGTTGAGGTSTNCACGTVFRISPSGNFTNLYSFNGSDGKLPMAGLVQGVDGDFYGATVNGGPSTNCLGGCGTLFRISPSGDFTNLYFFSGSDGARPNKALAWASNGGLYGTTGSGGAGTNCSSGCGTVFLFSSAGNLTSLYSFSGADGANPSPGLIQGSDGNFYGTSVQGGASGNGTLFRIGPSGNLTNLYSFTGATGGFEPNTLVQGSDGSFYGTTRDGGNTNLNLGVGYGIVFRISVPLNPPANQISAVQIAGNDVSISFPAVAYETYQLQFSSSMNPTNWVNVPGASVTNSIGALLTLTNFGGAVGPQGFYRFDITP